MGIVKRDRVNLLQLEIPNKPWDNLIQMPAESVALRSDSYGIAVTARLEADQLLTLAGMCQQMHLDLLRKAGEEAGVPGVARELQIGSNIDLRWWTGTRVLEATICYPRQPNQERDTIRVCLSDVRAADFLEIRYDFDRDGWVIMKSVDIPNQDSTMREAAFIPNE